MYTSSTQPCVHMSTRSHAHVCMYICMYVHIPCACSLYTSCIQSCVYIAARFGATSMQRGRLVTTTWRGQEGMSSFSFVCMPCAFITIQFDCTCRCRNQIPISEEDYFLKEELKEKAKKKAAADTRVHTYINTCVCGHKHMYAYMCDRLVNEATG